MAETLTPPQTRVEQSWRLFWTGILRDQRRQTQRARKISTAMAAKHRRR